MSSRGRTAARAGASASRSSSSASRSSASTSTSSGSSRASTSSSGTSTSGAGAARSARSSSSVSVSSPSGSKTVTTTKTTTPTETTKETTAQPQTPITVSTDLARAISDSQQAYPDAWTEATGTSNVQQQFEQVTGTTIPQIIVEAPEEIIEEPFIEIPELLPEVFAEEQQVLTDEEQFHKETITDNMVTQQMINFNIVNGRAVGSIKFVATNNFNPIYYGRNIVNIVQFKDPNGANILTFIKQNNLNFTETERDEVINYDEDMHGNTRATVESFVWSSATQPTAFSKMFSIEISEGDPPMPISSGFMGAGAAGAIAGLVLLGFIIDSKVGKR